MRRENAAGRVGVAVLLALVGLLLWPSAPAAQKKEGTPQVSSPPPSAPPGKALPKAAKSPTPGQRRERGAPAGGSPFFFSAPRGQDSGEPVPVHITADRLDADNKKKVAVFTGNVVTVKGDLTIRSDKLTIFQDEEGKKIQRMVAEGHVIIDQEKQKFATGDHAVYYTEGERVVLTGKPKAWEGANQVVGDKIEFFMEEDRSIVHSSAERRVEVTIYPRREEGAEPGRTAGTRR